MNGNLYGIAPVAFYQRARKLAINEEKLLLIYKVIEVSLPLKVLGVDLNVPEAQAHSRQMSQSFNDNGKIGIFAQRT